MTLLPVRDWLAHFHNKRKDMEMSNFYYVHPITGEHIDIESEECGDLPLTYDNDDQP